jgi:predicted ATP-dependent protease
MLISGLEHNIYLSGEQNLGRTHQLLEYLRPRARSQPSPPDLLYLFNFEDQDKPVLIKLPAGQGRQFKNDLSKTIQRIRKAVQSRFESESYMSRRDTLAKRFQEQKDEVLNEMEDIAEERGFSLDFDEQGSLLLSPILEGKTLDQDDFKQLQPQTKRRLKNGSEQLLNDISSFLRRINKKDEKYQRAEHKLNRETVKYVLDDHWTPLAEQYSQNERLKEYFDSARNEILDNIDHLLPTSTSHGPGFPQASESAAGQEDIFHRLQANLFVDNAGAKGAPIVVCDHPTSFNLLGSLDRESELGSLHTGYDLIRAGDVHRANHGYLVLHVEDVLTNPSSWEGLLRVLRSGLAKIEDPVDAEQTRIKTIEPEALQISLKVILVGSESTYELLLYNDDRFQKHFKIKAHLQSTTDRKPETIHGYLECLAHIITTENLLCFTADALAELVDFSSRLTEDQTKLSLLFPLLRERMIEASSYAASKNQEKVTAFILRKTVSDREYRSNLYEHEFLSDYDRQIIKVATQGKAIGQANGLSVTCFGDYEFGLPHQIACTVGVGHGGILDLEREAELGGPIHTKAMMIIKSYLLGLFAQDKPLVLTGSLCFEQSYANIEGDSASGAELAALLSALSEIPIDLSYAFTGAISQSGAVMAVGGVNQKIEGFFEVCLRHGLTSRQGVIIPRDNCDSLMLKDNVLEAVEQGQFWIFPVTCIEEAMEILTSTPCGARGREGEFPPGSLYRLVNDRLSNLASLAEKHNSATTSRHGAT